MTAALLAPCLVLWLSLMPPPAAPAAGQPPRALTAQERLISEAWIDAVTAGDVERVDGLLDHNVFAARGMSGISVPPEVEELYNGILSRVSAGLITSVRANTSGGGYHLLGHAGGPGLPEGPVLRVSGSGGFFYQVLILSPDGGKVVDLVPASTGEPFSHTAMRRVRLAALQGQDGRPPGSLVMDDLMRQAHAEGDWNQVRSLFNVNLAMRDTHTTAAHLMRLEAAKQSGDVAEFKQALEAARLADVGEIPLAVIGYDYAFALGDYPEALRSLGILDREVGGDLYLDLHRGIIHLAAGETATAKDLALRAEDAAPWSRLTWLLLGEVGLAEPDHDLTLRALRRLRDDFGVEFGDLRLVPKYATFVVSPQFRQWQDDAGE